RRIKLQLAFAKETKTRFVDGGRTNRPSVCRVDLLCSSGVNAGEIACGRARSLKLRERIERVVVVKIIVEREFLIVVEGMVDTNLELIAAIRLVRGNLHATAATRSRYVLQQAHRDRVEAGRRNFEVGENRAVRRRSSTARNGSNSSGSWSR